MTIRRLLGIGCVVWSLLACQFLSAVAPGGSGPSFDTSKTARYQYIFGQPQSPLQLTVTPDDAHRAQARIPADGGSLTATGADGTVFTLEIPAGALAAATTVTLTPLSAVTGLPGQGGPIAAVQVEPEGLHLYADAILTIAPAASLPMAAQLAFSYQGTGTNVGLALPVVDSPEIKLRLMHFSGYGVESGSADDVAAIQAQLGGDAEAALQSLTAQLLRDRREQALDNGADADPELGAALQDLMNQWEEQVVKPALEQAGSSCEAGKEAVRRVVDLERMRQLMGQGSPEGSQRIIDLTYAATITCVKEEYQRCQEEHHLNGMVPLYIAALRLHQLVDSAGPEPEAVAIARDLTVKCLTFELKFHSEGRFDDQGSGYSSIVDATVRLKLNPTTMQIKGDGPLDSLSFEMTFPNGRWDSCDVRGKPGGGTFEAKDLAYVEDVRSETDPEPYVRDFQLLYFPGLTAEGYSAHCVSIDSEGHKSEADIDGPPGAYWSGLFFVLHSEELTGRDAGAGDTSGQGGNPPPLPPINLNDLGSLDLGAVPAMPMPQIPPEGGFLAMDWTVTPGDALVASKEWVKEDGGLGLTEAGTLKLYHRPGE